MLLVFREDKQLLGVNLTDKIQLNYKEQNHRRAATVKIWSLLVDSVEDYSTLRTKD